MSSQQLQPIIILECNILPYKQLNVSGVNDRYIINTGMGDSLGMNKYGVLSILMVLSSVLMFFILRGPNTDLPLIIIILGSLSLFGIIFAVISKRWLSGIIGVLTNGVVLVFAYFLLLGYGIAG